MFYFISFILLCLASSLFHFLYSATQFKPLKIIAPIDESVFEHAKIIFYPLLIFCICVFFVKKPNSLDFLCVASKALVVSIIFMIISFYTYTGIVGKNYLILDIGIAFASLAIGLLVIYDFFEKGKTAHILWVIAAIILFLSMTVFTFKKPNLPLFKEKTME